MHSLKNHVALNIARLNRLMRKPPLEILTFMVKRSDQFLMHLRDRTRLAFGEIRLSDEDFFEKIACEDPDLMGLRQAVARKDLDSAEKDFVIHMRHRTTPLFYFDRKEKEKIIETIEKDFPESRKRTVDLAENLVDHKFHLLGNEVNFDGQIDWHFSENKGRRWPLTFSPNVDYFSPNRLGDIKIPWELNRTQHFVVLGKAYWYTGDEKYAVDFVNQLLSWIKENPYDVGINWMEGIETAIRLFSWLWAYHFFLDSETFDDKVHFDFLKSIYVQTKFIEDHLSDKWRINGNHLIAEAAALAVVGILFPEFKEANRWKKRGIELVERELESQILPDGVTWEHSTGYQKFVTDLCFLVAILMARNGVAIPETTLSELKLMTDFLNQTAKSDMRLPLVGDEDQGRVLTLDETAYDDVRSTTAVGSVLLGRKDLSDMRSEHAFWLLNARALMNGSSSTPQTSKLFGDSGFMVMRDEDKYLLFVTGPQDSRYLHAPHRHLDMLSIVLEAYGTYFLVDPGTYTYFGDSGYRKYFKSLKAHNSVVVDDKDPVSIDEAFELSRTPFARIRDCVTDSRFDWIIAGHDGYKSVNHIRQVFFAKPEYWIVIDLLEGEGEHLYDLYFHFNHGLKTELNENDQSVLVAGLAENVKISPLVTLGLRGEILEGELSPSYGVKLKGPVLRYRKRGGSPQIFVTVLYPYRNGSIEEELAKGIKVSQISVFGKRGETYKEGEVTGIRIDFGPYVDFIICSHAGKKYVSFADVEEVGKIFFFRQEKEKAAKKIASV